MPARALTVVCVALLCLFGAGPAAVIAATSSAATESRPASSAPAEPGEGQADPGEPAARAAVRTVVRGAPTVRGLPPRTFHVEHPGRRARMAPPAPAEPDLSRRTVRSVVLRC
ncbi:hypothetical protein [Streptomyces sp. RerS4]|uniref:hypothetical protein n=1 Tax=Streptomyces sp. RerS4 TaxID=2942449 RepID=UPI00201C7618|nr:hypothetical protein [Streptomyces sp. RerS4]UQX01906.1 hypothetical protein M4D82_16375 [Streptomyces sp. RerS4]